VPVYYGYLRWSDEEQALGSSLDRQRADVKGQAEALGARFVEVGPDDGIPGRDGINLKIGAIKHLRDDILAGRREPGIIGVAEPSRLSRAEMLEFLDFIVPLMRKGCSIASAKGNVVLDPSDTNGLLSLFAFLMQQQGAHRENETRISFVLREAELRRAKLGNGVIYSARAPDWIDVPRVQRRGQHARTATISPENLRLVLTICKESLTHGASRLAAVLNQRLPTEPHLRPWRGPRWTSSVLQNLVTNRALIGEFQPHKLEGEVVDGLRTGRKLRVPAGEPIPNYWPAAINADLWDRMQAAKATRVTVRAGRPSRSGVNLLAGMCRCACGASMRLMGRSVNGRGKNDYLRCGSRLDGGCTNKLNYSVQRTEAAILKHGFALLKNDPEFAATNPRHNQLATELDDAKQAADKIARRLANLTASFEEADTAEERAGIKGRQKVVLAEQQAIKDNRRRLETALAAARGDDVLGALGAAEGLAEAALAGDATARDQMGAHLRAILDRVAFTAEGHTEVYARRMSRPLIVTYGTQNRGRRVVGEDVFVAMLRPLTEAGMGEPTAHVLPLPHNAKPAVVEVPNGGVGHRLYIDALSPLRTQ
jgi:DNA invertase Pin-like site-specific DNA recombinase